MATTKITSPDLFDLGSLNTALKLPSGTTAERPTSPSTGEWRYNTTTNLVEFWDGAEWTDLQSEDLPPIPSENFNVVLYTGNGSTQSITGVGFKPDFVWIKPRNFADNHVVSDSTRGVNKSLATNTTAAEQTTLGVTSFDADGFSLPNWGNVNSNGDTFVAWCWKANGGTTTAGSGTNTTSVTNQVNTKAGFSISTFTGSASAAGNFTHGLGEVPDMYIVKTTSFSDSWFVWHKDLTNTTDYAIRLNTDAAQQNLSGFWNSTAPSSTLISLGNGILVNNATYVAYAFKSVAGYSSIGSYTGNGSTSNIIETGFEPAYVMIKRTDSIDDWIVVDNKRNTTNSRYNYLMPNSSAVENGSASGAVNPLVNFLTNGFQIAATWGAVNNNGSVYIYMAFAADPSAAPTLADSFANKLYTGTGSTQSITGLGFSPNYVWMKQTTFVDNHYNMDSVRGAAFRIHSNLTAAQGGPDTNRFTSFDTDGFTIGSDPSVNQSGSGFVTWNWKANSIPTINTDGTTQSIVSANANAGLSIIKWTAPSSGDYSVGHGLSSTPNLVIIKPTTAAVGWLVWHENQTNLTRSYLRLNTSDAEATAGSSVWGTGMTSTTIGLNVGATSGGNVGMIAYCFNSVSGFSKIGSYTGDGTTTKTITTGFQPDFVLIKVTDAADNWVILDSVRGGSKNLKPNSSAAEATESGTNVEFISTGFKLIGSGPGLGQVNGNGNDYIYMAFKEN